ncbi:MAG: magnesium transporter [Candidatus Aenigmarchaeota archaeon]|nr:magnesium transporter [Candidatus Aenigmarchaeota archaeon]
MQPYFGVEKYPHNSAGRRMVTNVPVARLGETVGSVINRLSAESKNLETVDYIYVVDKRGRLAGVFSVKYLFSSPRKVVVDRLMKTNLITVSPETDQEKVSDLALKHKIKDVPVVSKGKFLGVVPNHKIMAILNRSLQEDILHFAGIHKSHLEFENTLEVPYYKSIESRLPWLLVGLFSMMVTAVFLGTLEATLEKYLILAFFLPTIVYMSDAIGTQLQTLMVRDIAILGKNLRIVSYFSKQMAISLVISLICGVLTFAAVSFFWKQPFIGFVIASAMVVSFAFSAFSSLAVVYWFYKMGTDPAIGSGPIATVVSDVLTIVIYFVVALLMLG